MMEPIKSWFQDNQTMVLFLAAQAIAIGAAAAAILAYSVRLETRVSIMETRGAEYTVSRMNAFDQRITVMEEQQRANKAQLNRIVDILTKQPQQPRL
jgi:hypothetical protein